MYCVITVVTITSNPMNITLCLPQSTTANFTCVVDTMGISITYVTWFILYNGTLISTNGRPYHSVETLPSSNMVTSTLRVISVSMNDNGAQYQCSPAFGIVSDPAFLTVLGEIIIISSINTYKYLYVYIYMYGREQNKVNIRIVIVIMLLWS